VFQSFHLLPTLTALENVQIPMFEMPWNRKERRLRAEALLSEVGLENRMGHLPSELSGGERQRVAVARSLANNPQAIIADEPTGNLDSASAAGVIELLGRLHRERSTTLVIATHDMTITQYAKRVVTMRDGKIASDQIVGA
jgi:putative ABC transport system ATP-binding protein